MISLNWKYRLMKSWWALKWWKAIGQTVKPQRWLSKRSSLSPTKSMPNGRLNKMHWKKMKKWRSMEIVLNGKNRHFPLTQTKQPYGACSQWITRAKIQYQVISFHKMQSKIICRILEASWQSSETKRRILKRRLENTNSTTRIKLKSWITWMLQNCQRFHSWPPIQMANTSQSSQEMSKKEPKRAF